MECDGPRNIQTAAAAVRSGPRHILCRRYVCRPEIREGIVLFGRSQVVILTRQLVPLVGIGQPVAIAVESYHHCTRLAAAIERIAANDEIVARPVEHRMVELEHDVSTESP